MSTKLQTNEEQQIGPQESKKRLAIVQITRLGDLIQTYIACKEIKREYADIELVLIARRQFVAPLRFLLNEVFDHIFTMDLPGYLNAGPEVELSAVRSKIKDFLLDVNSLGIDVIVNLSFSKTSCFLTSLVEASHKVGPYYENYPHMTINDRWSSFIYSFLMTGAYNPFNLVDLFRFIIGSHSPHIEVCEEGHQEKKSDVIIVHPFASHPKKQWSSLKWTELIFKLLKENPDYQIQIVGNKIEEQKAIDICQSPLLNPMRDRMKNFVGKTSIQDVYKLLQHGRLFIGHDSMVGHLASIQAVPSITISVGTVRPFETMPYGEGNIVVSPRTNCFPCYPNDACDFFKCHTDIPFDVVSKVSQKLLNGDKITEKSLLEDLSSFHLNNVNIFESYLTPQGLLDFQFHSSHYLDLKDLFRRFVRISYLFIISEMEEKADYPKLTDQTYKELVHYLEGIQHLYELSEFGKKYSRYIIEEISAKSPNIKKIKEFGKKIDEIDKLQDKVAETYPLLSSFTKYFKVLKANLRGDNIVELTESSYLTYDNFAVSLGLLHELIDKTCAEYKVTNKKQTFENQTDK